MKFVGHQLIFALLCSIAFTGCRAGEPNKPASGEQGQPADPIAALEARIAKLRAEIAASKQSPKNAERCLALGRALRRLWQEHGWRSETCKGERPNPRKEAAHAKKAKTAREEAISVLKTIVKDFPKTGSAPEALFTLGSIYQASQMYEKCIEVDHVLLKKYQDARISRLVDKKIQSYLHRRIGSMHAALGQRKEAASSFTASLLAADNQQAQDIAIRRLLEYEPRLFLAENRKRLPERARKKLANVAEKAGLTVEVLPAKMRVAAKEEFKIEYRATKRAKRLLRDFCLTFRLLPAKIDEAKPTEAVDLAHRLGRRRHTPRLDFSNGNVSEGKLSFIANVPSGRYVLVCRADDFAIYRHAAVQPGRLPTTFWCRPAILEVTAKR